VTLKFKENDNGNKPILINSEIQKMESIKLTDVLRKDKKEENKEGKKEKVVNEFKHHSHLDVGGILRDIGHMSMMVTLPLSVAGFIAAALHDLFLAKSLIEAGLATWWAGFLMKIVGSKKKEEENWP